MGSMIITGENKMSIKNRVIHGSLQEHHLNGVLEPELENIIRKVYFHNDGFAELELLILKRIGRNFLVFFQNEHGHIVKLQTPSFLRSYKDIVEPLYTHEVFSWHSKERAYLIMLLEITELAC